jgi:HEAT repeat protein
MTRLVAVASLSSLFEPEDFLLLARIFREDEEQEVRREAAFAIRRNISAENWRTVFDLWKNDELHRHRRWAAEVTESFGDRTAIGDLERLAHDPDGHVRKAASKALRSRLA